jgi:ligand-binding sensor domain-containing protein/signal transduction histidine kinase
MRVRGTALGIVLFLIVATTASAQIIGSRRVFGRYQQFVWNDQHGLPQNAVLALTRTRDGYLWMGTVEGAARFDGVRFSVFNRSNTPALHDSTVMALLEDRDGALWLGTQSGIARLKDRRFTWYTREGSADDHINTIAQTGDGTLWFGTYRSGLLRRDGDRFIALTTADGLPHDQVWTLTPDARNRLWIGTSGGLALRDGDRFRTYTTSDGLPDNAVHALVWDRDGRLWVGTDRGVAWLQGSRFALPPALARLDAPISAFLQDRDGAIWIGTKNAGVYRFADGQLTSYRAADGLPDDNVVSLYQDPDGDIWIGTNGWGVAQLREPGVQTVTTQNGLAHNTVRAVLGDRDGALWIGTDHGLNRLANGAMTTYRPGGGADPVVRALGRDDRGDIWIAMRRGVARLRGGRFELVPELPTQLAWAMLADRAGNFWIATLDDGLYCVRDGRVVRHLTTQDGLPANELLSLYEDSTGAIWIGTFNRGLSRLAHDRITTWTTHDGLASNYILSFCETAGGTLWIGTHGGGLHRFKDGRFRVISTAQGLYDDLAFHVLDDGRGSLWMLGNRGIYRATLQSLNAVADGTASIVSSVAYGVADGMLNREGNGGGPAATQTRDGRLWFATMGGAVAIDPRRRNEKPPLVAIERVTIDRVEASSIAAVDLTPREQNLEIEYTGLSWRRPQQIQFRYRLLGLDRDWVQAGSRRVAYYSHLPPGRYTFQVTADNGDGVWNTEGQTLAVTVVPAFYQRWWFSPLGVASIGIVLAVASRYRLGQLQARQAVQQGFARQLIASQEAERKRIAAELHDGLGQHLVVIKNLALLTLSEAVDEREARLRLEHISDGASQAIREVREISQNLRPYQLDRLGLTLALQGIVKNAAAASRVRFTTDIDNIDEMLTKEAEINLYRVIQESVNNIVKHAEAPTASITVRRQRGHLLVTIADNGRGFDTPPSSGDARRSGFGLLSISERVYLLGGTVRIDSAPGRGTTVTMDIALAGVARGV